MSLNDNRNSQSQVDRPNLRTAVIGAVIGLMVGISANLVAAWWAEKVFSDFLSPATVLLLILFMVAGTVAAVWLEHRPTVFPAAQATYWIQVVIVSVTVVWIIATTWLVVALRPTITYFIVDATQEMAPSYDQMKGYLTAAALVTSEKTRFGLRVYGGQGFNQRECSNTKQLIEPVHSENLLPALNESLSSLRPGGRGVISIGSLRCYYGGFG